MIHKRMKLYVDNSVSIIGHNDKTGKMYINGYNNISPASINRIIGLGTKKHGYIKSSPLSNITVDIYKQ